MTESDGEAVRKRFILSGKVEEMRGYHENIETMPPVAEHILRALQREIIILTAEIVLQQSDVAVAEFNRKWKEEWRKTLQQTPWAIRLD